VTPGEAWLTPGEAPVTPGKAWVAPGEAASVLAPEGSPAPLTPAETPARPALTEPPARAWLTPAAIAAGPAQRKALALVPEGGPAARLVRAGVRWRVAVGEQGRGGAACPAPSVTARESGAAAGREPGAVVRSPRSMGRRSPKRHSMGPRSPGIRLTAIHSTGRRSRGPCLPGIRSMGRRAERFRWGVWLARAPRRPEQLAAGQGRGRPMLARARKDCPAAADPAARADRYPPAPSQS
jgi:hypothetical protein